MIFLLVISALSLFTSAVSATTGVRANVTNVIGNTSGGKGFLLISSDAKPACVRKCLSSPSCLSYFSGKTSNGKNLCRLDMLPFNRPISKAPYLAISFPRVGFVAIVEKPRPYKKRRLTRLFYGSIVEQAGHLVISSQRGQITFSQCQRRCFNNRRCLSFEYVKINAKKSSCRQFSAQFNFKGSFITNLRFSTKAGSVPPAFQSILRNIPKGETGNVSSSLRGKCFAALKSSLVPKYVNALKSLKVLSRAESKWSKAALDAAKDVLRKYQKCLSAKK